MNRIPVALFNDRAEAEPVQQRLLEAGVLAEIHDELRLEKLWFVPKRDAGARVEVSVRQFERAEQLLLDWDAAEGLMHEAIRCPECGSLRVDYPQFARNSLLTNLAVGLMTEVGLVERDYYCEDCHFTWPKGETRPSKPRRPHMAPYYFIEGVERTKRRRQNVLSNDARQQKAAAKSIRHPFTRRGAASTHWLNL